MKHRKRSSGKLWIAVGIFCLLAALGLTGYNFRANLRAQEKSKEAVEVLETEIPKEEEKSEDAELYKSFPEIEMPVVNVKGQDYIGKLAIPSLGLNLPIISEWGDAKSQIAPCRYKGSAYEDNLIIAGHNYESHFARLTRLDIGAQVSFTDMQGNTFLYQVVSIETIAGNGAKAMESGDWDLSLFTCNYSGRARVTVRCARVE